MDFVNDIVKQTKSYQGDYTAALGVAAQVGKDLGWSANDISSFQSMIPKFGEGGIVTEATLAQIGEAGPEAVIPLDENFGEFLKNAGVGGSGSSGGGGSITVQIEAQPVTIYVSGFTGSVSDLANQLAKAINGNMANNLVTAIQQAEGKTQARRR